MVDRWFGLGDRCRYPLHLMKFSIRILLLITFWCALLAFGLIAYSDERAWVSSAIQLMFWVIAALSLASPFWVQRIHVRKCAAYAMSTGVILVLIATKNQALVSVCEPLAIAICSEMPGNIYYPAEILSLIMQFHFAFFVGCVSALTSHIFQNRIAAECG